MTSAAIRMAEAATALLDRLDRRQLNVVAFPFDDIEERTDWHYVPRPRAGLRLGDLLADQRQAAFRLVATGLSNVGYASVATIVALEDVLDHVEERRRGRHSGDYSVSIFGNPFGDRGRPWGWRFEGHHVSLHHTVVDDEVSAGPQFLGANPARVAASGVTTVRPLGAEEELGRRVVQLLADDERRAALIDTEAPADIVTGAARSAHDWLTPAGVAGTRLGGDAARALRDLLVVYLRRSAPDVAERWRREAEEGELHFGWAGSMNPGEPHYYRLQGRAFLVEYDNTQDGANHIHTVWRSRFGDFGADLLAQHHRHAHGAGAS